MITCLYNCICPPKITFRSPDFRSASCIETRNTDYSKLQPRSVNRRSSSETKEKLLLPGAMLCCVTKMDGISMSCVPVLCLCSGFLWAEDVQRGEMIFSLAK